MCLSHLTYGASVRPENAVTYSAGNEGQKICGVFSETAPLQRSSTPSVVRPCVQSAIFPCVFLVYAHAYFSCSMIHRRGFSTLVLFIVIVKVSVDFNATRKEFAAFVGENPSKKCFVLYIKSLKVKLT